MIPMQTKIYKNTFLSNQSILHQIQTAAILYNNKCILTVDLNYHQVPLIILSIIQSIFKIQYNPTFPQMNSTSPQLKTKLNPINEMLQPSKNYKISSQSHLFLTTSKTKWKRKYLKYKNTKNEQNLSPQQQSASIKRIQRQILYNRFTLNFLNKQNNSFTYIPSQRQTFNQIKSHLISSPLYQRYLKINSNKPSLLQKLENGFNAMASKIKISKDSKVLVRNSYIKQPTQTFTFNRSDIRLSSISTQSMTHPSKDIFLSLHRDPWRLKDFYDHIYTQNEERTVRNRTNQKINIMNKIKKIHEECLEVESGSKEIAQHLSVFKKYNQQLKEKLVRKQRKIDRMGKMMHF